MSRMTTQTAQPAIFPYRENGIVKYATAPGIQIPTPAYDSDDEPLLDRSTTFQTSLDEYDIQHFTATGRPIPSFKASGLQQLGGHMYTVPQLLPTRYTDDSIIPAIVVGVLPSTKTVPNEILPAPKKSSFLSKLKSDKPKSPSSTKVVFMPRREYMKYFARGLNGEYIGSEPYKQWTEDELEETFAKYKPPKQDGNKGWARP